MYYLFNPALTQSIQDAFLKAVVKQEPPEFSDPKKRDYFFIKFDAQPNEIFDEATKPNIVEAVLSGDYTFSEYCNTILNSHATVDVGFRWTGACEDIRRVVFLGFAIKIIYNESAEKQRESVIKTLCHLLAEENLIRDQQSLSLFICSSSVSPPPYLTNTFFKMRRPSQIDAALLESVRNYIRANIKPIFPAYTRSNETGINPAYQDASSGVSSLALNQKKIWLFRTDFIVALGNKNAYWDKFSETGLLQAIEEKLHQYINWEDRYGHPSLACEYPGYDRSAYYGGLLAQRNEYLEVYTSSGRYYRNDLSVPHKKILEAYLAYELQKKYGEQKIVFVDAPNNLDYFEIAFFYHDKSMPPNCPRREYDCERIYAIFQEIVRKRRRDEAPCTQDEMATKALTQANAY